MDVNSKLQLKPGFQLTAESVNKLAEVLGGFQQTAVGTVAGGRLGLLPGHENKVRGAFVRDTFEVTVKDLMALLPSGEILNIDESAVIKVPLLYGDVYYLTVKMMDETVAFESEGIPFVRNAYGYSISTFEEMVQNVSFPLMRFVVKDGTFSVDDAFMMPSLVMDAEPRLNDFRNRLAETLTVIAKHPNIAKGTAQQLMFSYIFRLNNASINKMTQYFYSLALEMTSAIDFLIVKPNVENPEETMEFSPYDPEKWLSWLLGYIDRAAKVLDGVVIEKEKIDLEAIKQELRAEIYEHIQPDLEKMVNERVDNLSEALQTRIEDVLKDYVSGKIRGELHDALKLELDADLRATLYSDLYQALYAVLFVPKEEEEDDTFVPLM